MEMNLVFQFGFVYSAIKVCSFAASRLQHIHAINELHVSLRTSHVTRYCRRKQAIPVTLVYSMYPFHA